MAVSAPAAGGDPQKQLLSIIRDFAAEKSHGERRVSHLKRWLLDLSAAANAAMAERRSRSCVGARRRPPSPLRTSRHSRRRSRISRRKSRRWALIWRRLRARGTVRETSSSAKCMS